MHCKILKIATITLALCQHPFASPAPEHKEWFKNITSLQVKKDSIKVQHQRLWKVCESNHIDYCSDSLKNMELTFNRTNRSIDSIKNLRRLNPDSVSLDTGKYQLYRLQPLIIQYAESKSGRIQSLMEVNGDSLEIYELENSRYGERFLHSKKMIDQIDINRIVNTIKQAGILKMNQRYTNTEGDGDEVRLTISQNGSTKKIYTSNLVSNEINQLATELIDLSKDIHNGHLRGILSSEEHMQISKRAVEDFMSSSGSFVIRNTKSNNAKDKKISSIKFTLVDTNKIETISTLKSSAFWESLSRSILKNENIVATDDYPMAYTLTYILRQFKRYRFEIHFKDMSTLIIKSQEPIGSASGWSSFFEKGNKQIEYNLPYEVRQDIEDMITNESL